MNRLVFILCALLVAAPLAAQPILIKGGMLHTIGPAGSFKGDVLIDGGKIKQIGKALAVPPDARIIDAKGKPVTPGLMSSWTQLGIVEVDLERQTNDSAPNPAQGSAAFDVADAINPASTAIPISRIAGITRSLTTPANCGGVFCGTAAIIDLGDGPDPVVKRSAGVVARLEPFGDFSRPDIWSKFRETLDDAREYWSARGGYRRPGGYRDQRSARVDLEALGPVIRREAPLLVIADRAADIRMAVRYAQTNRLQLVILGGAEAWKAAPLLAAARVPVVVNAHLNLPASFSTLGATLKNAARLDAAGVRVIFQPQGDGAAGFARTLTQIAGNAVANGMKWEHALAAITKNPAETFGIGRIYGTMETGKDADLVVWDGDPLDVVSAPSAVIIKGVVMPLTSRQTMLRERYRDLNADSGYR